MEKGAYSGKGQWHRLLDVGWGGMGCVASLLSPPSFRRHTWIHPGTMGFGGGGELGFIARVLSQTEGQGGGEGKCFYTTVCLFGQLSSGCFCSLMRKKSFCLSVCVCKRDECD